MEIKQIVSDNGFDQNTYLVSTQNCSILIDCGCSLSALKRVILPQSKIDAIFLTHTHFDHIWGLKEIIKQYNCPVYVSKYCSDFIFDKLKNASTFFMNFIPPNQEEITFVELENKKEVIIGDIAITPIFTPGHSKCSVCYLIEDNLFCGDTALYGSTGRTDLWSGDDYQLETSLTKIKALDFKLAYSGHGNPMTKEQIQAISFEI